MEGSKYRDDHTPGGIASFTQFCCKPGACKNIIMYHVREKMESITISYRDVELGQKVIQAASLMLISESKLLIKLNCIYAHSGGMLVRVT